MAPKVRTDTTGPTEREQFQAVATTLGRALALTGQVAALEPGHAMEDVAIVAMDAAWMQLAGEVYDWAERDA